MRGHPVLCYLAPGPDFSGSQHPPRLLAQLLLGGKTTLQGSGPLSGRCGSLSAHNV